MKDHWWANLSFFFELRIDVIKHAGVPRFNNDHVLTEEVITLTRLSELPKIAVYVIYNNDFVIKSLSHLTPIFSSLHFSWNEIFLKHNYILLQHKPSLFMKSSWLAFCFKVCKLRDGFNPQLLIMLYHLRNGSIIVSKQV